MSLATQQTYMNSLFTASAVLAAKIGFVHLLTVRSRFMSGKTAQKNDKDIFLAPVFKAFLVCFGADLGGAELVERAERIAKNCAENEPFFLSLATVAGLSGAVPFGLGIQFIRSFTISRCLHTGIYMLGDKVNSFFRAGAWISGLSCTFGLIIAGARGSSSSV